MSTAAPPRTAAPTAGTHAPASPAAPLLRRSAAWLLDALCLSSLAAAIAWHWLAPAARSLPAAVRALGDVTTAKLVDGLLAGGQPIALARSLLHDAAMLGAAARVQDALLGVLVPWTLAYAALAFAWHVAGDLSRWQGSPGKHWIGLRVESIEGLAPTPAQALLREAGSALSWCTLNLGHALALVPPRRQSLHDRLARTRVVER